MAIGIRQRGGAVVDERRKGGSKRPLWSPSLKEKDLTEGMDEESLAIAAEADSPEQQRLDAAGIRTPTYERPSFFTNLLSGGAAGRQADDANTQSLRYKNDLLARQAELSEAQRQENARLDKTHGWNTEAATVAHDRAAQMSEVNALRNADIARKQLGYQRLVALGGMPTDQNFNSADAATRDSMAEVAANAMDTLDSGNQLKSRENRMHDLALQGNSEAFNNDVVSRWKAQGLANERTTLDNEFNRNTMANRISLSNAQADQEPTRWQMEKANFEKEQKKPLAMMGLGSTALFNYDPSQNWSSSVTQEQPMMESMLHPGEQIPNPRGKALLRRQTLAPGMSLNAEDQILNPRYNRDAATNGRKRIPGINQ